MSTVETWVPVEPIGDVEPVARDYFEHFSVGDRVRVRLSGECQQVFAQAIDTVAGPLLRSKRQKGHLSTSDGCRGTVVIDIRDRWPQYTEMANQHFFTVEFDEPSDGEPRGSTFAACELERLPQ